MYYATLVHIDELGRLEGNVLSSLFGRSLVLNRLLVLVEKAEHCTIEATLHVVAFILIQTYAIVLGTAAFVHANGAFFAYRGGVSLNRSGIGNSLRAAFLTNDSGVVFNDDVCSVRNLIGTQVIPVVITNLIRDVIPGLVGCLNRYRSKIHR